MPRTPLDLQLSQVQKRLVMIENTGRAMAIHARGLESRPLPSTTAVISDLKDLRERLSAAYDEATEALKLAREGRKASAQELGKVTA